MSVEEISIANTNANEELYSIFKNARYFHNAGFENDHKYESFLEDKGKNWHPKNSGDEVSIENCGRGEKCCEKSSEILTNEERKFERNCNKKFSMKIDCANKDTRDKIPEKHSQDDETSEMTSDDEFPKEIVGIIKESSYEISGGHTNKNKKSEIVYDKEFSKRIDGTLNGYKEKIAKKHTNNESQHRRTSHDEFPKQTANDIKQPSDKTHEKQIVNNKKLEQTSGDGLSKQTCIFSNKLSQKLSMKCTYSERELEVTYDKGFSKGSDKITIQPSGEYMEKYSDSEWKQPGIFAENSLRMNGATEMEFNTEPLKPQLIPTEDSSEKKSDIFDVVGSDGLWQRFVFSWNICFAISAAFHYMAMTFLAPDIDYWCSKPAGVNWTLKEWKIRGLAEDKHCYRYKDITKSYTKENLTLTASDIVTCDSWEYDTSFYTSTVVSQWDLVCGREWLASFSLSMFNMGTLISNLFIGHLSDILGRKRIIVACLTLAVLSATLSAFSLSYTMFVVTRFLTAFGLSGVFNVSYILLLEITGPKERPFYGVATEFGFCIGFISLPGVAWLLRDWFWIEIAITVPCVLLLLTCWLLPESPRWLMVKGRMKEAEKILIKSAKINGKKISNLDTELRTVMDNAQKAYKPSEASKGFIYFVCSSGLWRNILNIWFLWFVSSFIYCGLSYSTNALAGDPFVNFALSGAVEIPGYILTIFAIRFLGRIKPMAFPLMFSGIACLFIYVLPEDPWWLNTVVSMIGKCFVTIAANTSYISTAEIFPTVVRNAGFGSASFFARLGATLAPFVKELGRATHPFVPQIVFGVLGCFSGALAFFLPETEDLNVPETLEDAANRRNSMKNEA